MPRYLIRKTRTVVEEAVVEVTAAHEEDVYSGVYTDSTPVEWVIDSREEPVEDFEVTILQVRDDEL